MYGCANLLFGERRLQLNKLIFLQETDHNKKEDCDKMIDQKLMRTLTMTKFFNGAKVAERLLYNY